MNKRILFFSVNRHQKTYFDQLLAAVKEEDKGISLHNRSLLKILPSFRCSQYDIALAFEASMIRMEYFHNKTGMHIGKVHSILRMAFYFTTSLYFTLKFKKIITTQAFDIILLWNDMKWHQFIIKNLAEKHQVKTAFFENGTLPDTVTLDPKGVNYNSSIPRDSRFFLKEHAEEEGDDGVHRSLLRSSDLESGYIFVPFQVDYDTQIISHSPWVNNMEDFYQILERLLADLPVGLKLIIKEHPASSRCYQYLHHKNPRIEFKNTEDTALLISNSKLVITINSTVGLESIFKEKPVLVLGKAFYAIEGLCSHVEKESDLLSKMQDLSYPIKSIKDAFIRYLKEEYYVSGNWRAPSLEHTKAVKKRLYEIIE